MGNAVFDKTGKQVAILLGQWLYGPDNKAFGYVDEKFNIYDCQGNWTGEHLTVG